MKKLNYKKSWGVFYRETNGAVTLIGRAASEGEAQDYIAGRIDKVNSDTVQYQKEQRLNNLIVNIFYQQVTVIDHE